MKQKSISILLALIMMFSLLPTTALAEDSVSGSCGSNVTWTLNGSGTLTISGTGEMNRYWTNWSGVYTPMVKKVVINRGVNSIGEEAFKGFTNLTGVTIPSGVTEIDNSAFYNCKSLTSISIPSTVGEIESYAFAGCSSLANVTIANGVSEIDGSVFMDCVSLKSISLPSSITDLGSYVFSGCKNLATVNLPAYIDEIPSYAFADCTSLYTIKIPERVTEIESNAFRGCTNLTSVSLPKNLVELGASAFSGCTNLTSLTIPSGVKSISDSLCRNCTNLKYITILSNGFTIYRNAFSGCSRLSDVYSVGNELAWAPIKDVFPSSVTVHYNSTGPEPEVEEYTVWFDANGGALTADDSKTVTNGKTYGTLPTPTRTGYTFKGWYTRTSGGSKISASTKVNLTEDQTLYAQWTKSSTTTQCKITLNANGGTVSPKSVNVAKNSTYFDQLPTPTRSGYTFKGWYTASSGGTKITASTKATANRTIYAQWTKSAAAKCTITLNANGGSVSPKSLSVEKNSTYFDLLPEPTRPGYTFKGWYTTKTGSTKITSATKATASRTIYAQWTRNTVQQCKITLNANGGTVSPTFINVDKNSTYFDLLPEPTRDGYIFTGWYTTKTGSTEITPATKATANRTIYAHWEEDVPPAPQEVFVYFDPLDGEVDIEEMLVFANEPYGDLPEPYREGYIFDGWYTEEIGGTEITSDTEVTLLEDHVLFAHWTKAAVKTYTITFNANGGRVSPSSKKVEANAPYGELPVPTRDGYEFEGWYTSLYGGIEVDEDTIATANRTVYARWEEEEPDDPWFPIDPDDPDDTDFPEYPFGPDDPQPDDPNPEGRAYVVTFDPNGGRLYQGSKIVVSGSTYKEMPTPYRLDCHFTGWYTARSGGTKITEKTVVDLTGNQTLYAHWTKAPVTVKSRESGNWQIRFPSNFHFFVYNGETAANIYSHVYHGMDAVVSCIRRVELSNGTVRYYGLFGDAYRWFTYTCEMDVL